MDATSSNIHNLPVDVNLADFDIPQYPAGSGRQNGDPFGRSHPYTSYDDLVDTSNSQANVFATSGYNIPGTVANNGRKPSGPRVSRSSMPSLESRTSISNTPRQRSGATTSRTGSIPTSRSSYTQRQDSLDAANYQALRNASSSNPNEANYFAQPYLSSPVTTSTAMQTQPSTTLPKQTPKSSTSTTYPPPLTPAGPLPPSSFSSSPSKHPSSEQPPLNPHPPNLSAWRTRLFNIPTPLLLSSSEYQTYFPHVDNVYSHRSTQKYKRKPFVSHYWDCRLKGRPPGTQKSDDPSKKKRKRTARERDLCDFKIKVVEYFSREEVEALGLDSKGSGQGNGGGGGSGVEGQFVLNGGFDGGATGGGGGVAGGPQQGGWVLGQQYPVGHPGRDGGKWYMISRVSGGDGKGKDDGDGEEGEGGGDGEEGQDGGWEHKHTLEESDRIKKNSVQRWLLKEEKERKRGQQKSQSKTDTSPTQTSPTATTLSSVNNPSYQASGLASRTIRQHLSATHPDSLTLFAHSFCPFAQRIWIALEIRQIPYRYVEVVPAHLTSTPKPYPPEMVQVNPECHLPSIRHGTFGVWESGIMMEYLEDLDLGQGPSLLPLHSAQLRAHSRLWTDHINRKILPAFYALLLTPPESGNGDSGEGDGVDRHGMLITTLQTSITSLVNASHATGPFFLGEEISFVDVVFAPWIIRLSRVLSYYRNFPRPEVGTRWRRWVDAIETDERVRRTVSDEKSYHGVYGGVGEHGWDGRNEPGKGRSFAELNFARQIMAQEGFGLGGDIWGRMPGDPTAGEDQ